MILSRKLKLNSLLKDMLGHVPSAATTASSGAKPRL